MAYVITRLCRDCLDMGCVEVCPVECIYVLKGEPDADHPPQLYIHPTECINCSACEPECPWQAIYEDQEIPEVFADDVALNARCESEPKRFEVAQLGRDEHGRIVHKPAPSGEAVEQNKIRWGLKR